jgi:uncharacterized protein YecT (DUF1311 family)
MQKRSHRILLLAALSGLVASPLAAQTQATINASAAREAQTADRALNAQYQAALARISAPSRLLLRDAQRAWVAFRDAQCKFEINGVQGGTAVALVQAGCRKQLTELRTRQLQKVATCEEGDLACPQ